MLWKIHLGESCSVDLGDAVFSVLGRDGRRPTNQHVALCYEPDPVPVRNTRASLKVLEYEDFPQVKTWPTGKYRVQLVGQMVLRDEPLRPSARIQIVEVAWRIVRRKNTLIDELGYPSESCQWLRSPYKYVVPNRNDPDTALEMHFTCATFVEYCYERAGYDIVKDGHDGKSLPEVDWDGESLPRLFPGYLIKAFDDDTYPLDLEELARSGYHYERFQYYPFEEA